MSDPAPISRSPDLPVASLQGFRGPRLRAGVASLLVCAGLVLPFALGGDRFLAFVLGISLINVVWASGMNLLYGYVGLMPLMYAGIAGVAAYAMIELSRAHDWSFWLAMPGGALIGAAVGVLLGLPSLRLRGFYFTLCSLVIQTVLTLGFVYFRRFTNGDTGINQIAPPDLPHGQTLHGPGFEFALALFAIASTALVALMVHRPIGRRFIAVREDEILAEALGVPVVRTKILAFFLASLYAGIGGCLYASYVGFVSPRSFDVLSSLSIWLFVAFGGRGSILGPVLGVLVLSPIPYLLQDLQAVRDVLTGALVIVVTLVMPGGVYGALGSALRRSFPRPAAARTQRAP